MPVATFISLNICPVINIRPYKPDDAESLLEIFDTNVPAYFHSSERQELVEYLDEEREDYFVIEYQNTVVGAGGINYIEAEGQARLSWDFIHASYHGQGLGRLLVEHRINWVLSKTAYRQMIVRTAQFTYLFYAKFGFSLVRTEPDYWAKGYDLYLMMLDLDQN